MNLPPRRPGDPSRRPRPSWTVRSAWSARSPGSARPSSRDLRAGDTDRDRVVDALNAAYGEGRLTPEEHDERVTAALAARTLGDLAGLLVDLPGGPQAAGLPDFQDGPMAVAFGRRDRSGPWVVPARLTVSAVGGSVRLDLTEATLADRHVEITALCGGGSVDLVVPASIRVDVEGSRLVVVRRVGDRWTNRTPSSVVTVRALGVLGRVQVETLRPPRPPRRSRWGRDP